MFVALMEVGERVGARKLANDALKCLFWVWKDPCAVNSIISRRDYLDLNETHGQSKRNTARTKSDMIDGAWVIKSRVK